MVIYFDMDGTLCDFYGVAEWKNYLALEDTTPYEVASPRFNFSVFARRIHILQAKGYQVGIISWLSKSGSADFQQRITDVKIAWLRKHLPSVSFDEIHIVPYGTPKQMVAESAGILFDDEERNRSAWCGNAYDVENILEILKALP